MNVLLCVCVVKIEDKSFVAMETEGFYICIQKKVCFNQYCMLNSCDY